MYWTTDCILMVITHKPFYHMGQQNTLLTHVSYGLDNRLYITLLMGITHKPMYHMDWTTDCILPF